MYKKADDVFFRKYGDSTVVYKTGAKRVFVMNAVCFSILSYFCKYHTFEECIYYLADNYNVEISDDFTSGILSFLGELESNGIISKEYRLHEEEDRLEETIIHGDIIPPQTLQRVMFELTYRCNERCRHCYCVGCELHTELTTKQWKDIMDELSAMNVFELTFTGGDIFVRKDAFELLEYAFSKNFLINIFTNGNNLKEEDFYRLQRIHPKSISFSLYNYIAEKHDDFTQVVGSFEKTVSAAKKCVALGIPVNIKSSIVEENFLDVEGILALVQSLGATAQMSMAISPTNDKSMKPTDLRLAEKEKYFKVVKIISDYMEHHNSGQSDGRNASTNRICWAGENSISINPYGDVFPCNALLIPCGNIKDQSVQDIWENSEQLKQIRGYTMNMVKGCGDCEHRKNCAFCMGSAFSETGDPLTKYSEACNITLAQAMLRKEKMT